MRRGLWLVVLAACGSSGGGDSTGTATSSETSGSPASATASTSPGDTSGTGSSSGAGPTSSGNPDTGSGSGDGSGSSSTGAADGSFVVVTFNTGTTPGLSHNDGDAYGQDEADISDEHYGNGLAWMESIASATSFLETLQPDIITFQEIFHPGECAQIPVEFHPGFICETWQDGDPTVAQMILGDGYQIACHLEKPDKCAAVKKTFGSFPGCDGDLCLDFLDGVEINNCGGGSRVGRGLIELADGGELTLVSYHGTSGLLPDDWNCRIAQIDQIFVDFDGEPAANGERNLIAGDLNTDPYRAIIDLSATRWLNFVGEDMPFWFISDAGQNATPTYNGFNIDHVISDTFTGSCVAPGITVGEPAVHPNVYFDHTPVVCTVNP